MLCVAIDCLQCGYIATMAESDLEYSGFRRDVSLVLVHKPADLLKVPEQGGAGVSLCPRRAAADATFRLRISRWRFIVL
jgi:hypothetical protein